MEVYYNGEWGTVCDSRWDLNDAQVVCSELDYGTAIDAMHNAFYGQGTGRYGITYVKCIGTEGTIRNCSQYRWGYYYCSHSNDAGVRCSSGNFIIQLSFTCCYINLIQLHTLLNVCDVINVH